MRTHRITKTHHLTKSNQKHLTNATHQQQQQERSISMFAMKQAIPRIARQATRKVSTEIRPSFLPKQYKSNTKKDWLSDPSTYPIIAIMGFAMAFVVGMGVNALAYKDVQLDPKKRNSTLRTWGEADDKPLLGKVIYERSWQKNAPEGMGVDHKEWLKGKEEYAANKKQEA